MVTPTPSAAPPTPKAPSRWRPRKVARGLAFFGAGLLGVAVLGVTVGELQSWRFLGPWIESQASQQLGREVSLRDAEGRSSFRLRLIGPIRLHVGQLRVANGGWAHSGPMVALDDGELRLRWRDLLAGLRHQAWPIESLHVARLRVQLERRADGTANWTFPGRGQVPGAEDTGGDALARLRLARLDLDDAQLSFHDAAATRPLSVAVQAHTSVTAEGRQSWRIDGDGRYGQAPVKVSLWSAAPEAALDMASLSSPLPVKLEMRSGDTRLDFLGLLDSRAGLAGLRGRYDVAGSSLYAMGAPFGLTLPTTGPFELHGLLGRAGNAWATVVQDARIGRSRLEAALTFGPGREGRPTLQGHLGGRALWLQDLGPSVGAEPTTAGAKPAAPPPAVDAQGRPRRVLPDRPFDLPSLRGMDANIRVSLDRFESGSPRLTAVQPLRAQLSLDRGRLAVGEIDARLAQGRLRGRIALEAEGTQAVWSSDLAVTRVRLEDWIRQGNGEGRGPYATGWVTGRLQMNGRGRSAAELLGGANGRLLADWSDGTLSHLALEAAGLDLAQAVGVLIRGDAPLPVNCGVADVQVKDGVATPRLLLVDTRDSTVKIEGQVSLKDERLALVAKVAPKDASPLALRTPFHVDGPFSKPELSLEKAPLLQRLVPAALLAAIVNPALAVLPLIDLGDADDAGAPGGCRQALAERLRKQGASP